MSDKDGNTYTDELKNFIGRSSQLKTLTDSIESTDKNSKLILLSGEGGVGKTFLTRYFYREILKKKAYTSLEYDFDSYYFHDSENLRLTIAHKWKGFLPFRRYLNIYKKLKTEAKNNREFKLHLHEEATKQWLEALKNTNKKIVIIFDTLDTLSEIQIDNLGKYFFSTLPTNALFIVSGRDKAISRLNAIIQNRDRKKAPDVQRILLNPLNSNEFDEFIKTKLKTLRYSSIDDLPAKKMDGGASAYINFVKKASKGLPILIDLSLEHFSKSDSKRNQDFIIDINNLLKIDSTEAIAASDLEARFKQVLIRHYLQNYSNQLRDLVLALAHAWPMGKMVIEEILESDDKSVHSLMDEARKTSYIKRVPNSLIGTAMDIAKSDYFLSLQDVMREMINEYAWSEWDQDKEFRRDVSKLYLARLEKTIKSAEKKLTIVSPDPEKISHIDTNLYILSLLLQRLKIQRVRHTSCLNIKKGLKLYIKSLKERDLNNNKTESQYINELTRHLEEMMELFHKTNLTELLSNSDRQLQSLVVDFHIQRINFLASRNRFQDVIDLELGIYQQREKLPFELEIKLFEEIASIQIKRGDLQKGLDLLKELKNKCDDFSRKTKGTPQEKTPLKLLFHLYTTMGWAYRLIGDIKKADKTYEFADDIIIEKDLLPSIDIPMQDVAMLYQTWAYVKALLGDGRTAKDFIDTAHSKYKELSSNSGLGRVESVAGRIKIEFDEYDAAIECFKSAEEIFSDDNIEWQSKIYLGLAHTYTLRSKAIRNQSKESRKQDINQASEYIQEVIKWNMPAERPEAFFVQGNIYLNAQDYERANEYFIKAWGVSKKQGSIYFLYRSLIGQIRATIFMKETGKDGFCTSGEFKSTHNKLLQDWGEINKDTLGLAIYERTLGDLLFLEGKYDESLNLYMKSLPVIAEEGRFYAISIKGQLDNTEEMLVAFTTTKSGDIDSKKMAIVHDMANKLWVFWKVNKFNRQYRKANPIIRSWISGKLDEWNHADEHNNTNMEENNG